MTSARRPRKPHSVLPQRANPTSSRGSGSSTWKRRATSETTGPGSTRTPPWDPRVSRPPPSRRNDKRSLSLSRSRTPPAASRRQLAPGSPTRRADIAARVGTLAIPAAHPPGNASANSHARIDPEGPAHPGLQPAALPGLHIRLRHGQVATHHVDGGMAQRHLQRPRIALLPQELDGERMPKPMRRRGPRSAGSRDGGQRGRSRGRRC